MLVGAVRTTTAADGPDPALLEFLGATSRLEASGVDVERLVAERLARERPDGTVMGEADDADATERTR